MRYFSMFSGIGGFEKGIEQAYGNYQGRQKIQEQPREGGNIRPGRNNADNPIRNNGIQCIGYSEIDKYAIQIYSKHYPEHKNYGSATDIDLTTLPDFDLLVGGFPCQAFSIAGKRRGFEDTRGTLFFDIAKILREKRPRHFVLENVKGLLSHDNGNTFKTIISTLAELGYGVEWQVLNSKNFGVPQNRERVFIVGHLGGFGGRQVFPIREGQQEGDGTLGLQRVRQIAGTLRATDYKGTHNNIGEIIQLNNPVHSNNRIYSEKGVSPTLNTAQGGNRQPKIESEYRIRRLTPKECERLQGFPDDWTAGVSDTQRYKCCGNAVTVNVVEEVIKRLLNN